MFRPPKEATSGFVIKKCRFTVYIIMCRHNYSFAKYKQSLTDSVHTYMCYICIGPGLQEHMQLWYVYKSYSVVLTCTV